MVRLNLDRTFCGRNRIEFNLNMLSEIWSHRTFHQHLDIKLTMIFFLGFQSQLPFPVPALHCLPILYLRHAGSYIGRVLPSWLYRPIRKHQIRNASFLIGFYSQRSSLIGYYSLRSFHLAEQFIKHDRMLIPNSFYSNTNINVMIYLAREHTNQVVYEIIKL